MIDVAGVVVVQFARQAARGADDDGVLPHPALDRADLFAAIGTSGNVYPAAGFVDVAAMNGAETVELNLAATAPGRFDRVIEGPASRTVPEWVASLIG